MFHFNVYLSDNHYPEYHMRFGKNISLRHIFLALLMCLCITSNAQRVTDPLLKNIVKSTLSTYEKKPYEKLYVQTDKPVYLTGDTLRLKAYLLNGDYRGPSAMSGILYVELDNEAGKSIRRIMLPVNGGLAWADMALDTADIKKGNYTLRAYTNWMRNFGEDYILKKNIIVSGHQDNPVLVKSLFKQTGNKVETGLQFSLLDGKLVALKDVELTLMSGKKNISKDKFTTGIDGKVTLNFAVPEGDEPISIKAVLTGSPELTIPVILNREQNIDVQFMPEGGALVAGIQSKVGIKAIGENGKGINISGKIYNSKGEEVSVFSTMYNGMGNVAFTSVMGESYTAKLNGNNKTYPLPQIKHSGTVLNIAASTKDSLKITIIHAPGTAGSFYLIGQARGVVCYAEPISLTNGTVTKSISKNLFPTGITRFTLINSTQQPVNERIVFINHNDEFRFNIQPGKNNYTTRDSIALTVNVTDKTGKPVQGNFSIAVTDNSQVSIDSLASNMLTHLLLTSDLKGEVEQPGYYFTGNKEPELDNLMLTQGWVGYEWKDILSPETKPIAFQPEREYIISGKVTNALGKPMEKSPIALLGNKPLVAMDTLTDKNGRFLFTNVWPVDTAVFKLQARNKNNKEFNVTIKMDEQIFPEFKTEPKTAQPWYVNTDTTLLKNAATVIAEKKARREYKGEGTQLRQVEIKAKKVVKGSKNLNGPGEADLVLDEQDMLKAGKRTLKDLLKEKVPGIDEFGKGKRPVPYALYGKRVSFVFDGIDIDKFFHPDYSSIEDNPMLRGADKDAMKHDLFVRERTAMINNYLNYYTAEDVVGIELMFNPKYNRAYASNSVPGGGSEGVGRRVEPAKFNSRAYIEITTRTKHGPFMHVTPGTYLYKPLAFTMPKQFYSPKYTANNKNTPLGTDMRSTIFWEPNLITDAAGKATVSFYSADKAADYSVIIEGTDMSGGLGFGKREIRLNR